MDKYMVVGDPVGHSLSPRIHQLFAEQTAQSIAYSSANVAAGTFAKYLQTAKAQGVRGFNIKYPLKQEALAVADEASDRAQAAGAASCLVINKNGKVLADNFDGQGLVDDLVCIQKMDLTQQSILVVGAGNVAASVLPLLVAQSPKSLTLVNRTHQKAHDLVAKLRLGDVVMIERLATLTAWYDLVINVTAASLANTIPKLPASCLSQTSLAYDVEYRKGGTAFTRWACAQGANALDGLGMLVAHNMAVFALWRGVRPDPLPVYERLLRS